MRQARFIDLVRDLQEDTFSEWPLEGPRTTLWLLRAFASGNMTPTQRHFWWRNALSLTPADNGVEEHLFLCECLEWGVTFDFLASPNILVFEHISRRFQLWEEIYSAALAEQSSGSSGVEWAEERHIFLGRRVGHGSSLVCPSLQEHVAKELAQKTAVLKERRKGREERRLASGTGGDDAPGGGRGGRGGRRGR